MPGTNLLIADYVILVVYELSKNSNIRTHCIVATGWVDGELSRIAFEMFTCEAAANILVIETGTLAVLQARCRTVHT